MTLVGLIKELLRPPAAMTIVEAACSAIVQRRARRRAQPGRQGSTRSTSRPTTPWSRRSKAWIKTGIESKIPVYRRRHRSPVPRRAIAALGFNYYDVGRLCCQHCRPRAQGREAGRHPGRERARRRSWLGEPRNRRKLMGVDPARLDLIAEGQDGGEVGRAQLPAGQASPHPPPACAGEPLPARRGEGGPHPRVYALSSPLPPFKGRERSG